MKFSLVLWLVLTGLSVSCCAIDVSARSAILYEPKTGTVLYEKNAEEKLPIASTTKIMTAIAVIENADVNELVTVPKVCTGIEGTSMYLKENESLSVTDLLYGMLLSSGNDAAMTLAHYVGDGDISGFVSIMNKMAKRLGMRNSLFANPSGLPATEHYSTAYDMAILSAYAIQNPVFAEIVSTKNAKVAGRYLENHNKMLRIYEGATGVKTGYTKAAGRCLVSSAERDGMSLVSVTLSAPDDWNDHRNMFDYGFSEFKVFDGKPGDYSVPIISGKSDFASIKPAGDISILAKTDDVVECVVYLPEFIYAPVSRGDIVGRVAYLKNGVEVDSVSLVSDTSVAVTDDNGFFGKLFWFLRR